MQESLEAFRQEMTERINRCATEQDIEQLRVEYLGRKGKLTQKLRSLKDVPAEERPQLGEQLNQLRGQFEEELDNWLGEFKEKENERILTEEHTDITLPGNRFERGRLHPITIVLDEIIDVFASMGFEIARGPDIEDDYHNFNSQTHFRCWFFLFNFWKYW